MSLPFIVSSSINPIKKDERRYYPRAVTVGKIDLRGIALEIKQRSSLSLGDIQSVLSNFTEVMTENIRKGIAVHIDYFAQFRPRLKGVSKLKAEDVSAKDITDMSITVKVDSTLKPIIKNGKTGDGLTFSNVTDRFVGGKLLAPEGMDPEAQNKPQTQPQKPATPNQPQGGISA